MYIVQENSKSLCQGSFKNGKKHGLWVSYKDKGKLNFKRIVKDGWTDGPRIIYHKNG
jgi:antitoxin component YwqK of YwqJK toxin-antitoxin module